MEVMPAVDVLGGRCVQLVGGDPSTAKDYGSPVDKARQWKSMGAGMLHFVDLDATLGSGNNFGLILKARRAAGLPAHFGGGVRTLEAAGNVLSALGPSDSLILGTLAVREYPDFKSLKALSADRGRIIVSVDSRDGFVAVKGWTEKSKVTAEELMSAASPHAWGFLYTDVNVEGRMAGIDGGRVSEVVKASKKPVIVSGGISSKADVDACRQAGAWGVVLGKALYEGRIRLEDLI